MDTLTSRRNRKLSDAGDALQVIEMIMGEFSGLGLCDIIAIVGSLYVMPLTSVLGLLDYDAYGRAKTALGSSLPSQDSIVISMNNMASYVNGFYQIMDQVFQDYIGNNANTQTMLRQTKISDEIQDFVTNQFIFHSQRCS